MKNLSRATVDVLIATTDGETISIVLFRLGKYPSEITDLGSSGIFSSSISLHENKNKEDKMVWLSKFCDGNISQSSLSEKFQIGEFFDENWEKEINVTCLNKLS